MTYSLQSFLKNTTKEQNFKENPTFVLLSCEKNKAKAIVEKMRCLSIVSEVKLVEGMYDVVIRLDSPSFEEIKKVIVENIRGIEGVRTCITLEGAKSFDSIKRLWKQDTKGML